MDPSFSDLMSLLTGLVCESKKCFSTIKYDIDDPKDKIIVALYATIIDLADTCLKLLEINAGTAIPIIIKTILEAYSDLINIIVDETYIEYLSYVNYKDKLALYRAATRNTDPNPILSQLASIAECTTNIIDLATHVSTLKDRIYKGIKFKKIKIKNKLGFIDMLHEYESIYRKLCFYAHSNLEALTNRNSKIENGKNVISLNLIYSNEDLIYYPALLIPIVLRSTEAILDYYKSVFTRDIKLLRDRFNKFKTV